MVSKKVGKQIMTSSMLLEAQEYKKHTGYPSPCQDDGTPAGGTGMTSGAASRHGASQPESRRAHNGKWYTIEEFQAYVTSRKPGPLLKKINRNDDYDSSK